MAEIGMDVPSVANGPAPEDAMLEKDLESKLRAAEAAAEHHEVELARAKRIGRACAAALGQLRQEEKVTGGMTDPGDLRF